MEANQNRDKGSANMQLLIFQHRYEMGKYRNHYDNVYNTKIEMTKQILKANKHKKHLNAENLATYNQLKAYRRGMESTLKRYLPKLQVKFKKYTKSVIVANVKRINAKYARLRKYKNNPIKLYKPTPGGLLGNGEVSNKKMSRFPRKAVVIEHTCSKKFRNTEV